MRGGRSNGSCPSPPRKSSRRGRQREHPPSRPLAPPPPWCPSSRDDRRRGAPGGRGPARGRAHPRAGPAGADGVLLMVAALGRVELKLLHDHARGHGLDVLVEAHDAGELAIAVDAGARIIGVNNRNLRTRQVDVPASETLIAQMPAEVIAVSESGLKTAADLVRLKALGYRAFLIGERFMTSADPGAALAGLLSSVGADLRVGPKAGTQ